MSLSFFVYLFCVVFIQLISITWRTANQDRYSELMARQSSLKARPTLCDTRLWVIWPSPRTRNTNTCCQAFDSGCCKELYLLRTRTSRLEANNLTTESSRRWYGILNFVARYTCAYIQFVNLLIKNMKMLNIGIWLCVNFT